MSTQPTPTTMRTLAFTLAIAVLAVSCKKEFDSPPVKTIPVGGVLTLADLRSMFTGNPINFTGDSSVYAVVTADEQNGNLYKNVYVQDHTAAIVLRLLNSGGLYQGDSIRIYLPGCVLGAYNGMLQLDSVNVDNNVVKQATLVQKEPQVVTIAEVNAVYSPIWAHPLQGKLVKLNDVQFIASEAVGATWGDYIGQTTVNRTLQDCNNATAIVRNSGYSNFASHPLPQGGGSFVGVMGSFGTTAQLFVRSEAEALLNGPRCNGETLPVFFKNFNDASITSNGWSTWSDNNIPWSTNTVGSNDGTPYAQCKNFINSVNVPGVSWLISPAIDLTGTTNPRLSFITACNYTGDQLQVLVSTDFSSGDPSTGTWTALTPTLSAGSWAWTPSGNIDMTPYITASTRVAFKYVGTSSSGKTWELDDIKIVVD